MILVIRMRQKSVVSVESAPAAGAELFTGLSQKPGRRWFPLTCSVVIHALLISLAVYSSDHLRKSVELLSGKYTVRYLRLSAAAPVRSPNRKAGEGSPLVTGFEAAAPGKAGSAPPSTEAAAGEPADLPRDTPRPTPRVFEFPKLPVKGPSGQVLLQPELPPMPVLKRDLRMPELLIWRPQPPLPAPPPRKTFVAQQRPSAPSPIKNLPAPPSLDPPNAETNLTDLAFSGRITNLNPSLVHPAGTTAPLRAVGQGESSAIPQIAPAAADNSGALNILSIPDVPLPGGGVFEVAPGNQAPGSTESSAGGGSSGHASSKGGAGSGTGLPSPASGNGTGGRTPGAEHGAGGGSTEGYGSGSGGRNSGVSGAGGQGEGADSGSGSPGHGFGAGGTDANSPVAGPAPSRNVTTVVHSPDGHFNILVESSGSEAFAETEGVLSGRLIYTVYVRAGTKKDWILQYCLPRAIEQRKSAKGKAPPLEAPYPFLILRPDLVFGPDIDYLIVHGIVDLLGKFDQLNYIVAPAEQTDKDLLLNSLRQWKIRPGRLDGQPIALEVLLIIPREEN